MGRLEGKVAIVTGSARGIGREIALCYAKEGAAIVVNDVLTKEMEATAEEIRGLGKKAIAVKADVSQKKEVQSLFEKTLEEYERIDILVNNAGIARHAPFLEITEEIWDRVLAVNLKGPFLCSQAVAPHMMRQKYGKIINISSSAGIGSSNYGMAEYAPAKAGLIMLTKVCATELGPYGINVNAIAPGAIVTDITYSVRRGEELEKWIELRKSQAVLRRLGTTQDMANLALFLASDESSFISGQVIASNGGRTDLM